MTAPRTTRGSSAGAATLTASFTALSSELVLEILQLLDDAALRNAGESCRLLGALEATEWQQRAIALAGDAPGAACLRGVPVPEGGVRAHGWRETHAMLESGRGVEVLRVDHAGRCPSPRFAHSVVAWRDSLILFGGRDDQTYLNDIYRLRLPGAGANPHRPMLRWERLEPNGAESAPAPRRAHAATVGGDGRMYVLGGGSQVDAFSIQLFSDLYALEFEPPEAASCAADEPDEATEQADAAPAPADATGANELPVSALRCRWHAADDAPFWDAGAHGGIPQWACFGHTFNAVGEARHYTRPRVCARHALVSGRARREAQEKEFWGSEGLKGDETGAGGGLTGASRCEVVCSLSHTPPVRAPRVARACRRARRTA